MHIKQQDISESRIIQLEEELKNREFEINLLKETSYAISQKFELDKLLQLIARRAQDLVKSETLLIPLLDEKCTQYTYKAGYGKNTKEIIGESLPLDFGICGWVWKHKKPWWRGVLDELSDDEKNLWEKEAGSVLVVPLLGKRNFLGGIAAINKQDLGEFTKRDLEALTMFATQVTIAIENAMFFEEMMSAKNEAESLQKELESFSEDLENIIEDRTYSLKITNDTLEKTIDSLKETQDQLIQSEKLASLGGLVAGISHEINTPIGIGITSASHIEEELVSIKNKFSTNTIKKSELDTFFNESLLGLNLLNDNLRTASDLIRSFKQVAVDQSSNEPREVKLSRYIDKIFLSLRPKLKLTKIDTKNTIPDSIEIITNPGALSQIVTNLMMNSITHAFPDNSNSSEEQSISISGLIENSNIKIIYRDNGQGMNEQDLSKIFDPFFTTKRGQGGSGLGMSIAYNLATSLDGSIKANSKIGKGLEVIITIPVSSKSKQ